VRFVFGYDASKCLAREDLAEFEHRPNKANRLSTSETVSRLSRDYLIGDEYPKALASRSTHRLPALRPPRVAFVDGTQIAAIWRMKHTKRPNRLKLAKESIRRLTDSQFGDVNGGEGGRQT
jgi:hypothetical protein